MASVSGKSVQQWFKSVFSASSIFDIRP
jgi:hypothetical protein